MANAKRKAVSRARTSAAALKVVGGGKVEDVAQAVARHLHLVPAQPGMPETAGAAKVIQPWSDAKGEEVYSDFSNSYGKVLDMAEAIVAGAYSHEQVRKLWARHEKDNNARRFLGALKTALVRVQALPDGSQNKDAFTYNVHPKTKVLVWEKVKGRKAKFSMKKQAERIAKLVISKKLDDNARQTFANMMNTAILSAEEFLGKPKAEEGEGE